MAVANEEAIHDFWCVTHLPCQRHNNLHTCYLCVVLHLRILKHRYAIEERLNFKSLLHSKLTSSFLSIDAMGLGTLEREDDEIDYLIDCEKLNRILKITGKSNSRVLALHDEGEI